MGYLGKEVEASFKVECDVTGRAQCRQCKKKMNQTELRMGKLVGNFFVAEGDDIPLFPS